MHLLLCNLPQPEGVIHQNHCEDKKTLWDVCTNIDRKEHHDEKATNLVRT
jgi:hypothetical protein